MPFVLCPRCQFSQLPGDKCRRCGTPLDGEALTPGAVPAPAPGERGSPPPPEPAPAPTAAIDPDLRSSRIAWISMLAAAALLVLLFGGRMCGRRPAVEPATMAATPTAGTLDLAGRWRGSVSKTIGGNPPRPALKEVTIESDRQGLILAARVVFTDPGRGGAGAGYRVASDGGARLEAAAAALAAEPRGATLTLDFLDLPGWVPSRPRLWKGIESSAPGTGASGYLLVESLETDYLLQAGFNESGFLSYAFFSSAWAPPRGADALSTVIHPEPGASLRGFQNLVWDLSGAADFLKLQVPVTVSGIESDIPDRLTLTR